MTQLCAIPGCRIRNRHLGDCDSEACGGCLPRVATEGLVCDACTGRTADRLTLIAELAPDARLVAAGLIRRGGNGSSGKPGSRPPLNDGATDALDEITNALTTIAREIADTRGLKIASGGRGVSDPLTEACSWLCGQMSWLKDALDDQGGPYAVGVFAEIGDCASRMRGLVDGPSAQKYLGPCDAPILPEGYPIEPTPVGSCEGDVYGYRGARTGTCRTCGAHVDQAERSAWLDGEVRQHAYRAVHITEAYGVPDGQIRVWAARGQLRSYWVTDAGLTIEWTDPPIDPELKGDERKARDAEIEAELKARGPRVYYVGDVLDLAAAQAVRREEKRAERARRAAARQTAEMGA